MASTQYINTANQKVLASDQDLVSLPDLNIVASNFVAYVIMLPNCTVVTLSPISGQTINSLTGNTVITKTLNLNNRNH